MTVTSHSIYWKLQKNKHTKHTHKRSFMSGHGLVKPQKHDLPKLPGDPISTSEITQR